MACAILERTSGLEPSSETMILINKIVIDDQKICIGTGILRPVIGLIQNFLVNNDLSISLLAVCF